MEISDSFDTYVWYGIWGLNLFTTVLLWAYIEEPAPWGKFHHLEGFYWTKFQDTKVDPGLKMDKFTLLMELPHFVYLYYLFPNGRHANNPKAWILIFPYILHYIHRTFVYAWCLSRKNITETRLWLAPLAVGITFAISCSQIREISHHHDYDNDTWFWVRVSIGLPLYLWGLYMRIPLDNYLTNIKVPDGKYKVPRGGWFELVDCPHYLGELSEWLAWFIMVGSFSTFCLFIYPASIMIPRAIHIHEWYSKTFEDYPKNRKRIIPYVW